MRTLKRFVTALLCLCLLAALTVPVLAAEGYSYTVRIFSGKEGTINGQEVVVYSGLSYGDTVTFDLSSVTLKDGSKYYVKGVRESGRDNNTAVTTSFTVTQDQDYVVAYGMKGNAVSYTARYLDESGTELRAAETYYGNVGDSPAQAYVYIDGYQPKAAVVGGKLSAKASENSFDFFYKPNPKTTAGYSPNANGEAGPIRLSSHVEWE